MKTSEIINQVREALSSFTSDTRLYELSFPEQRKSVPLLVEAFAADERVLGVGYRDVIALSTNGNIAHQSVLGQRARLAMSLADRTRAGFGGYVSEVATLGCDGALTRYRLRLSPWIRLLTQVHNSRAWQNCGVREIVDAVFSPYQPHAQWRWSDEVNSFLADAGIRASCTQYRETDAEFVTRLLTEEGLAWRFEDADGQDRMVLFSDSSRLVAVPEDSSSAGDGIRYHAASSVERSDSIQHLEEIRTLGIGTVTLSSYDYIVKRTVSVSVPTRYPIGGKYAQGVEIFDCPGHGAFADRGQARRNVEFQMQAHEARTLVWQGRSTARTLCAGTRIRVTGIPMKKYCSEIPAFVVLRVASAGVNNLPVSARDGLATLFGPVVDMIGQSLGEVGLAGSHALIDQARRSGYANCFEAIPVERPWRPTADDSACIRVRPTATGSQSAIVVGPDGSVEPNGADEVHCDRMGRVRVRFHWQESSANCWVRVAQRSAGAHMGSQFIPRIGQEVLVKFIEGDIDQPVIVGALYNGQGEGGVPTTPGGRADQISDSAVFEPANDHRRSGQGNLAGGNSPVWHGASGASAGHRNPGAQWGVRSKELGGRGYNQLVFDDTDGQGRVQLKTTQAASELNLGHLIHNVDNYRGTTRGRGAELRTDAYGAVRAGEGLLISSYKIAHAPLSRAPAGNNMEGNALLKRAMQLAASFNGAATMHQSVAFGAHLGSTSADASSTDSKAAPLKALWTTSAGAVSSCSLRVARADAAARNTKPHDDKLAHTSAPMVGISAKAGLGMVAGQDVQLANGETVSLMNGIDSQFVAGGQMQVHSGQAIGVLAGAVGGGEDGAGLQLIAAKDEVAYQAQSDKLQVQARDEIDVVSATAHIDWAAAKSISLSTAGGANITIAGGNITVQCPGKLMVHAGMKKFAAPDRLSYPLPKLPRSAMPERALKFKLRLADTPGPHGHPLAHTPWKIASGEMPFGLAFIDEESIVAQGETDADGNLVLTDQEQSKVAKAYCANPERTWLVYPGHTVRLNVETESADWSEQEKLLQAMNAADFSGGLHSSQHDPGAAPQARYAKAAFDVSASKNVFPKVKES